MGTGTPPAASEYQRLPHIAARIGEFCGLDPASHSRCVFVTGLGQEDGAHATWGHVPFYPPEMLPDLLATGKDVARSLWDTGSLLVYVDLDYRNAEFAGDAFLHPADSFLKLEPTYRASVRVFAEFEMPMLDLVTGAGYGFVGRVDLSGRAVDRLAALTDRPPDWYRTHPDRRPAWSSVGIPEHVARAYHGLGLVLEHFAHLVLLRVASSTIPVVVNNPEVGAGPTGRESASIDLTHMGDPLDSRLLRVAFGAYQKHRLRPDLFGASAARLPALAVIPRYGRPLLDILQHRDLSAAAEPSTPARIPDVEEGLGRLVDDYEASGLAEWHRAFARAAADPPERWPAPHGRMEPADLPPCVARCLEHPNDLLLKPEYIQFLVRTLLARGWNASHVAGLVRAYYLKPGLWGEHWRRADPSTRAEYDVRVFAGLIAMGLDEGIDFNCVSTQEKRMCPGGGCPFDLRQERDRLLAGRRP